MTSVTGLRSENEVPRSSTSRLPMLVRNWLWSRLSGSVEKSMDRPPVGCRMTAGKMGWSRPRRSRRDCFCAWLTLRGRRLLIGSPGSIRNRKKLSTAMAARVSSAPPSLRSTKPLPTRWAPHRCDRRGLAGRARRQGAVDAPGAAWTGVPMGRTVTRLPSDPPPTADHQGPPSAGTDCIPSQRSER